MAAIKNGKRTKELFLQPRRIMFFAIPIATVNMGAYVIALKLTTVANVMIVYATIPVVAAVITYFATGENTSRLVLIISLIAFAGVAYMVGGATQLTDIAGCAVALLMTLCMAIQIIMARQDTSLDMSVVNAYAALACTIIGLQLAQSNIPHLTDMLVMAAFGISNTALAYFFVMVGARYIPPAEVGLIGMIDVILGPLWVWLLFSETPGQKTLVGGVIVLAAISYYLTSQLRIQGDRT